MIKKDNRARDLAQWFQYLPCKCKDLSLISGTEGKKKKKGQYPQIDRAIILVEVLDWVNLFF